MIEWNSVRDHLVGVVKITAAQLISLSICFGCDRLSQQKKKFPARSLTAERGSRRKP